MDSLITRYVATVTYLPCLHTTGYTVYRRPSSAGGDFAIELWGFSRFDVTQCNRCSTKTTSGRAGWLDRRRIFR
jgi:hypothetical protein